MPILVPASVVTPEQPGVPWPTRVNEMPRGTKAPKLWPACPLNFNWIVSSGSPLPPYFFVSV